MLLTLADISLLTQSTTEKRFNVSNCDVMRFDGGCFWTADMSFVIKSTGFKRVNHPV